MSAQGRIIGVVVVGMVLAVARYSMRSSGAGSSPPGRSDIVNVEKDDARMDAAIAEARKRWPDFIAAWNQKKPGRTYAVKVPFKARGGGSEHMWVKVDSCNGRVVSGRLIDRPYGVTGKKPGDRVSVEAAEVEDWLYEDEDGTITGAYTQKVLDEVQKLRR